MKQGKCLWEIIAAINVGGVFGILILCVGEQPRVQDYIWQREVLRQKRGACVVCTQTARSREEEIGLRDVQSSDSQYKRGEGG